MKQTKFYLIISTALLSMAAYTISKANKSFTTFTEACFGGAQGSLQAIGRLTAIKGPMSRTLWLVTRTNSGTTILHTAVTCQNQHIQLYLK